MRTAQLSHRLATASESATLALRSPPPAPPPSATWTCPSTQRAERGRPPRTRPKPVRCGPGAKDRATEERRAGLHERSQGGRLASACGNRDVSLSTPRGPPNPRWHTQYHPAGAAPWRDTSLQPTNSPHRQQSRARAPSSREPAGRALELSSSSNLRDALAAGRVAGHPQATMRPPAALLERTRAAVVSTHGDEATRKNVTQSDAQRRF